MSFLALYAFTGLATLAGVVVIDRGNAAAAADRSMRGRLARVVVRARREMVA